MSRKNKFKQRQMAVQPTQPAFASTAQSISLAHPLHTNLQWILAAIPAILAIVLYFQTLQYQYALDDITVITQNKLVQKGFAGIPDLLRTDYWYGFTDKIRGHQYRPLSLIMFATEHQLAPGNPMVGHLVNVLLYALTASLLFLLLSRLFTHSSVLLPFMAAVLFVAHPLHTEVVSNIKSRDEILCLFLGLCAVYSAMKYFKGGSLLWVFVSGALVLLALMSKETAIAFLILIPLSGYYFGGNSQKRIMLSVVVLLAFIALYFFLRHLAVKDLQSAAIDPLDNTIMLSQNKSEEWGTALSILLRYIGLLLVPFKLSYDYSFSQIPINSLGSTSAIAGLLIYAALLLWAIWGIKKKTVSSWAIFFFLITLAPVSNIFFKIGSTMAERFLYIPSVGFCVLVGLLITQVFKRVGDTSLVKGRSFAAANSMALLMLAILTLAYGARTVTRSKVWENNITLFQSGLLSAPKSARVHYNWGTTLLNQLYKQSADDNERAGYLLQAKNALEESNAIYPTNIFTQKNLAAVYINTGEYQKAMPILNDVLQREPNDTTSLKNAGRCYGNARQFSVAASYFERCISLAPQVAENYQLAGSAYQFMGDFKKANEYFDQARRLETGIK